jgi:hypothetical protein
MMALPSRARKLSPPRVRMMTKIATTARKLTGVTGSEAATLCQLGISSTPSPEPIAPVATYLVSDQQRQARLDKVVESATNSMISNSGNKLLVIECGRSVQDGHWNSAANDG